MSKQSVGIWAILAVVLAGCAGEPGRDGRDGVQGPEGPAGSQGQQGLSGPTGATGSQGAAGPEGPAGPAGPAGAAGAQGVAGPAGIQGPAGPQGAQGAQGPAGPAGPAGPPGPNGFHQSGQRLKVRYLAGQDGSQQFMGWFDSLRNEQCGFFDMMGNGQHRCVPSFAGIVPFLFSDPACTQVVVQSGPTVFYAVDFQAGKIYQLGPQIFTTLYTVNASLCEAVGMVSNVYALGSEVPVTEFVSATEMIN